MQFWEKKKNINKKLINLLLFSSFSIKTWKKKEETLKNPFSKRNIYFFCLEMACITFNVTLKRDFLQNVVKTNKKV